ncbi:MAG: PAS domain-containing protein [Bacteroidota bacterium]|nr:PAS domain-containing protein [Bacteroidota bacterium]MDX5430660.1 PAS domain-containing protein [Bacteroidota bacterium]
MWEEVTRNKTIADYNASLLDLVGLKKNELSQLLENNLFDFEHLNELVNREVEYLHPKLGNRWFSVTQMPIRKVENFTHILVLIDITTDKLFNLKLSEAYEQKTQILESIGDAFFSLDNELNITYWNRRAENLLQLPREKALGQNVLDLFGELITPGVIDSYDSNKPPKEPVHFRQFIARLDKWFEVSVYPGQSGTSVYFSDITSYVKHQKAIEKRNEKLSEIAWIQSHIVRAPLARIMGIVQLMDMEEIDPKTRTRLIGELSKASRELDGILHDIVEKANMIEKEAEMP